MKVGKKGWTERGGGEGEGARGGSKEGRRRGRIESV